MITADASPRARAHPAPRPPPPAPLWRGLVVYRVVALVAVVVNLVRFYDVWARPALGIVVVAAMAVWTAISSRALPALRRPGHRRRRPRC